MTPEERKQLMAQELQQAEKDMAFDGFVGAEIRTDVYRIPTGRKIQVKIIIEADEHEFEEPTGRFRQLSNQN